jgi:hypothetical protein
MQGLNAGYPPRFASPDTIQYLKFFSLVFDLPSITLDLKRHLNGIRRDRICILTVLNRSNRSWAWDAWLFYFQVYLGGPTTCKPRGVCGCKPSVVVPFDRADSIQLSRSTACMRLCWMGPRVSDLPQEPEDQSPVGGPQVDVLLNSKWMRCFDKRC